MTWTATTASYRVQLHVGMSEKMYTPAEVKKLHPKSGQMMIGGTMGMGSGMSMTEEPATPVACGTSCRGSKRDAAQTISNTSAI